MSSQRRPSSSRGRTTRGPLPPDVYWRRRLFVALLAFSLVFVLARWLTGSSDGASGETPVAEQAGAQVSATQTVTAGEEPVGEPEAGDSAGGTTDKSGEASATVPTLAAPEGTCTAADVAVTPSVAPGAVAGQDVGLALSLQTLTAEACTWEVSGSSVVVRIAQGKRQVWSTGQCPLAVPTTSVVLRRTVATVVQLTWPEARESDEGCTRRVDWVAPGDFTIAAASLGGEPAEAEFTLGAPAPRTVEVTQEPKKKAKKVKKPTKPVN